MQPNGLAWCTWYLNEIPKEIDAFKALLKFRLLSRTKGFYNIWDQQLFSQPCRAFGNTYEWHRAIQVEYNCRSETNRTLNCNYNSYKSSVTFYCCGVVVTGFNEEIWGRKKPSSLIGNGAKIKCTCDIIDRKKQKKRTKVATING